MFTLQKGKYLQCLILGISLTLAIGSSFAAAEEIDVNAKLAKRLEAKGKIAEIYKENGGKDGVVIKGIVNVKSNLTGIMKFAPIDETKTPSALGGGSVTNCDPKNSQSRTISLNETRTSESNWSSSSSFTRGISASVTGTVPFVGEATVGASAEWNTTDQTGGSASKSLSWSDTLTLTAEPLTKTTTQFRIYTGERTNVPYTITTTVKGPVDIAFEPKETPVVTFYEHKDYGGKSRQSKVGDEVSSVGDNWNDIISSIKIGKGAILKVFKHTNYRGKSKKYTGGDVSFVGKDWNDIISSYKVTKDGAFYRAAITIKIEDYLSSEADRAFAINGVWKGKVINADGEWWTGTPVDVSASCKQQAAKDTSSAPLLKAGEPTTVQTVRMEKQTTDELSKPLPGAKAVKKGVKAAIK